MSSHSQGWFRKSVVTFSLALSLAVFADRAVAQSLSATGGFVELATSTVPRAGVTPADLSALPQRGAFTFPAPYNTTGFRITNATDCGGRDCVKPVGYSYWANINNHVGSDTMLVFLGLERRLGGTGPTLFSVNKRTGETRNEGALFPANHALSWASGEGWYFSAEQPHMLYLNSGSKLQRYDVMTRTLETVFDVATQFGPNRYIWQIHSSADDRVHSATLRDSTTTAMLGCVTFREDQQQWYYAPAVGRYDECQVDKSGRWLVIKENVDGRYNEDNRIIDLFTGTERVLLDQNGAGGHSDLGFGYMIAFDNFNRQPGAVRVWQFDRDMRGGQTTSPDQGTLVYQLTSWQAAGGHITHANSKRDVPLEKQVACSSSATRHASLPRVNEIVCYRLDGTLETLVVAPNLTNLDATGGSSGGEYGKLPKGNLDPTGEYFIWTTNAGGNRLDAYIVRVPKQLLVESTDFEPVRWSNQVNVSASDTVLQKVAGCQGCPDAGAVSEQQLTSGDGVLRVVASEVESSRVVGLSNVSNGTSPNEIRFGLRLRAGIASVIESGNFRKDVRFSEGDVFEIQLIQGRVHYFRNGMVLYSSTLPVQYPLLVDSSLSSIGATLKSITIKRN